MIDQKKRGNFYLGTSGLLLPVPNKLYFPEEFQDKSRLNFYSSLNNSIEINSSFYKIPLPTTVEKWTLDVPENFLFTFKIYKEITHSKGLAFDSEILTHFFNVINKIRQKKGCLLIQFPPSIRIENFLSLQLLLSEIRENDPNFQWNIAVEFRHQSLYIEEVYELLEHLNFGIVFHDKTDASSSFVLTNSKFIYLRFHGPDGNYRNSYADDFLGEYASYIVESMLEGKDVYVYFNNSLGAVHKNLNKLRQLVVYALKELTE